ncbi:hypothetical protein PHYBOEH_005212 [Phytophthora boehmeriae]|uniref:RxLR effector protein n=1 Tax=Phytophthora boehmeriae TaxID=109152 RepID=A0A8T1WM41_9STRA|nr:hypothetical protein PHYBOEH_005212 [Phytophthora boehmeriae]
MRVPAILLLVVIIFLHCCDALPIFRREAVDRVRMLRVEETKGSTDEEKGIGISSLTKKLFESKAKTATSEKVDQWVKAKKSRSTVLKKLGLKKLSMEAERNHPNYKYLKEFEYKDEGRTLDKFVSLRVPTSFVWEELYLRRTSFTSAQFKEMKRSDDYRMFKRYAEKYDNAVYTNKIKPSFVGPPTGGYPAEWATKVELWAEAGRPGWYVKKMLGHGVNPYWKVNLPYYNEFLARKFVLALAKNKKKKQ